MEGVVENINTITDSDRQWLIEHYRLIEDATIDFCGFEKLVKLLEKNKLLYLYNTICQLWENNNLYDAIIEDNRILSIFEKQFYDDEVSFIRKTKFGVKPQTYEDVNKSMNDLTDSDKQWLIEHYRLIENAIIDFGSFEKLIKLLEKNKLLYLYNTIVFQLWENNNLYDAVIKDNKVLSVFEKQFYDDEVPFIGKTKFRVKHQTYEDFIKSMNDITDSNKHWLIEHYSLIEDAVIDFGSFEKLVKLLEKNKLLYLYNTIVCQLWDNNNLYDAIIDDNRILSIFEKQFYDDEVPFIGKTKLEILNGF